jgi:integrase/recombinase XerD
MDSERIFSSIKTLIEQRHLSPKTFDCYRSGVKTFCEYYPQKDHPKNINRDEIIKFLAWVGNVKGIAKELQCFWALHFLYIDVMGVVDKFKGIKKPKIVRKIPEVISHEEFMEAFDKIRNPHEKAMIALFYATGIRISELCQIECKDVNRKEKSIYIRWAKGNKTRYVAISEYVQDLLDAHWKSTPKAKRKFKRWLFAGINPQNHIGSSIVWKIVKRRIVIYRKGIQIRVYPHLIRHCFGTYLHEQGVNLKAIADTMGHASTRTTEIYTHTSLAMKHSLPNPFDCKKEIRKNALTLVQGKAA